MEFKVGSKFKFSNYFKYTCMWWFTEAEVSSTAEIVFVEPYNEYLRFRYKTVKGLTGLVLLTEKDVTHIYTPSVEDYV